MEYPNLPERKLIDVPETQGPLGVPADISQIICPIFSKVMPKFTKFFGMTFAKKGTYGVPEFAGMEVNRRSGKLKGLSGYLQTFDTSTHLRPASPADNKQHMEYHPHPHPHTSTYTYRRNTHCERIADATGTHSTVHHRHSGGRGVDDHSGC